MTELQWLGCTAPAELLAESRPAMSERKQRLCAVAWVRLVVGHPATNPVLERDRHWIDDPTYEAGFEAAERFADGLCGAPEVRQARTDSGGPHTLFLNACRARGFSLDVVWQTLERFQREYRIPRDKQLCCVLRDLINPYAPTAVDPAWLAWGDGAVANLAAGIYADRAFDRMPILADALEDAGCADEAILSHLRSPGPHVRGCWALDLILGKG